MVAISAVSRIELPARGSAESAIKSGEYWAKRFNEASKPYTIEAKPIKNGKLWKITIEYQGEEDENTLS